MRKMAGYNNNKLEFNKPINGKHVTPIGSELLSSYDMFVNLGSAGPNKGDEINAFMEEVANDPMVLNSLQDFELKNKLMNLLHNSGTMFPKNSKGQSTSVDNSFKGTDYETRQHDSQFQNNSYKPYTK